ncbi:MAG: hypothetical protein K2X03_26025 [Bryobacteraceae bacterium]|nr:hypothetical protein [Bryobacteraceae bacterium]
MKLTVIALVALSAFAQTADKKMSFFITSAGKGQGADLGGLKGADAQCQMLAKAVGSKKKWRAYLSATAEGGKPAVNAKDRIGKGPWYNSKGVMMAKDVADLHSDSNNLKKDTSLTEKGEVVNGRGDTPNQHDVLTGSQMDGTLTPGTDDTTCKNWTSHGEGSAMVGHHDRQGGGKNPTSWNFAHPSKGCSQANLVATGGAGRYYCFATN